jgi:hypothetical protein
VVEAGVECLVRFTGAGPLVPFPRDATKPGPSFLPPPPTVSDRGCGYTGNSSIMEWFVGLLVSLGLIALVIGFVLLLTFVIWRLAQR